MRTPSKIITALALAGLAVAGGAAFTGGGLTCAADPPEAFVGGAVSTAVDGAVLNDVDYEWTADLTGSTITRDHTHIFRLNTRLTAWWISSSPTTV